MNDSLKLITSLTTKCLDLRIKNQELKKDRDYWKAEALKHCAKLDEIKLLVGRSNEWQRLN